MPPVLIALAVIEGVVLAGVAFARDDDIDLLESANVVWIIGATILGGFFLADKEWGDAAGKRLDSLGCRRGDNGWLARTARVVHATT